MQSKQDLLAALSELKPAREGAHHQVSGAAPRTSHACVCAAARQAEVNTRILERERAAVLAMEIQVRMAAMRGAPCSHLCLVWAGWKAACTCRL